MKFDEPLISILVANYNNGKYISTTLESVCTQTYKNIEIVIVDDKSTDDSIEIIEKFAKQDCRIRWYLNSKNLGYGFTIKRAIDKSKGEYIARVDPDDKITPDAIELLFKSIQLNPKASMIYSTNYICDEDLNIKEVNMAIGPIPKNETYLTIKNNFNHHISQLCLFRKKYYDNTCGLNPSFRRAVDKDLYYKLEEVGEIIFINNPLYYYRQHKGSISLFNNSFKAIWWEIRAKKMAYKRRLKMNAIPNLKVSEIKDAYEYLYKELIKKYINEKKYLKLIYNYFLLFYCTGRIKMSVFFIYYSLKKAFFAKKYDT